MKPLSLPDIHSAVTGELRAAGCVFAEEEADLLIAEARSEAQLTSMVERRAAGLPLEHILGWAEFCGRRILVGPGVFVPRPRSEFLIGQAAALTRPGDIVLDMGCGSGALGVALHAAVGGIRLYATDIEAVAVEYARKNLEPIGGEVFEGDLYDNLPPEVQGRVDIMLVNAPYVPTDSIGLMPAEARLHEPLVTLDGGPDGLDVQRRVAAEAAEWLRRRGRLLVETSERQAPETAAIMARGGLEPRIVHDAELDATVVVAVRTET